MSSAKRLLRSLYDRVQEARLSRTLEAGEGLLYAGMADPHRSTAGGAVKLRYLARAFPESGRRGRILYLVSSALPRGPLGWARAARAKGIRIVLNQNGVAYPAWADERALHETNGRFAELLGLADHVLYQSAFCEAACEAWVGKRRGPRSVVHNPVDTDLFRPNGAKRGTELLLMGSCSQRERVRVPLEALALAKRQGLPWKARIAGRLLWLGADAELAAWISELGLQNSVERVGSYAQEEAPRLYSSARVLVHLQDKDASPTVPLEAMACGTPVLAIASGGLPELVPQELGVLLPVASGWDRFHYPSPEAVLGAAKALLDRELAGACRAHVEAHFSLSGFLRKHEEIFAGLR